MKSSFLSRQKRLLSVRPLVVGTLVNHGKINEQFKTARRAGIDILELRLDTFPEAQGPFQKTYEFGRSLLHQIKEKLGLPVLLTLRAHDERGLRPARATLNDAHRAEILARLLPSVDLVDLELRHAAFARRMTVIAHIHGVDVVHSAHNFSGVWTQPQLTRFCSASEKMKGDVFKVAVTPRSNEQLEKFLFHGRNLSAPRKVLIGMGKVGLPSRLLGFSFGSILTYGHLGRSAAPGQIPAADLVRLISDLYGER
jgi:3-dehydroquinate dehydratase-1